MVSFGPICCSARSSFLHSPSPGLTLFRHYLGFFPHVSRSRAVHLTLFSSIGGFRYSSSSSHSFRSLSFTRCHSLNQSFLYCVLLRMAYPRMPRALIGVSFFLYTLTSAGFVLFPRSSVENAGYSDQCVDALSTNITQCNNVVSSFDANTVYSQKILELGCTDQCGSALVSWEEKIKDSCSDVTYVDGYGRTVPISSIASIRSFNFNQTCRMNDGEFCNSVLGNLTMSPSNSSNANDCNKCALLKLHDTAQFQYNDGPLVYSKGIYQSYTSSCHFTGYPLTITPTPPPMASSWTNS